jgi:hypothetical protein
MPKKYHLSRTARQSDVWMGWLSALYPRSSGIKAANAPGLGIGLGEWYFIGIMRRLDMAMSGAAALAAVYSR